MNPKTALSVAVLSCLGACGGGGSSAPPPAFAVASTSPASAATGVARTTSVTVAFDAAPSLASVGSAGLTLTGPEGNVIAGTASVSGNNVLWSPAQGGLPGSTTYTLKVAASVADTMGRPLAAPYSTSFTTADPAWQATSTPLANTLTFYPTAVADRAGNLAVSWYETVSSIDTIYVARYRSSTGTWGAAQAIYAVPMGSSIGVGFDLSTGLNGDVLLTWAEADRQTPQVTTRVKIARLAAGAETWSAPTNVDLSSMAGSPGVWTFAGDGSGNILGLVWMALDAGAWGLFGLRADPAGAHWSASGQLDSGANLSLYGPPAPMLQIDGSGNGTAAWRGAQLGLMRDRYDASTGAWGAPLQVAPEQAPSFWVSRFTGAGLSVNDRGDAAIVWSVGGTPNAQIWGMQFNSRTGTWSAAARLDAPSTNGIGSGGPWAVIDAAGIATVAWTQSDGSVRSSRSNPTAATWSAPQIVAPASTIGYGISAPPVADAAGNVTALIVGSNNEIASIRYIASQGAWQAPVGFYAIPSVDNYGSSLSEFIDVSGSVTAFWCLGSPATSSTATVQVSCLENQLK